MTVALHRLDPERSMRRIALTFEKMDIAQAQESECSRKDSSLLTL